MHKAKPRQANQMRVKSPTVLKQKNTLLTKKK